MARLLDRLIGHGKIMETLLEAQGRERLASTLLFAGPSGIGKKLAAFALAQSLICERKTRGGCGECGSCLRISTAYSSGGQSESLMVVAPEGSGIKIEQARDVLQFIALRRLGFARVVIVDQAHLLNPQAANSLLKSLEEPPPGTYFVLVTPAPSAILPTIRSRSQLVRFAPLTKSELKTVLGPDADDWVLEAAHGSVETAALMVESRSEFQELEEASLAYLAASETRFPSDEVSRLKELTKERSAQAFFSVLVQGVLRDGLRLKTGLKTSSGAAAGVSGARANLARGLASLDSASLSDLAEASLTMEHDMGRNVDRGLLLENFALKRRRAAPAPNARA